MLDKNCFQLKKHNETKNVLKRLKRSTCICEVYVQWKDGPKYWVKTTKRYYKKGNWFNRLKRFTCVCEVYVQWNDGTKYWVKMKDIKALHPLKTEKYDIK